MHFRHIGQVYCSLVLLYVSNAVGRSTLKTVSSILAICRTRVVDDSSAVKRDHEIRLVSEAIFAYTAVDLSRHILLFISSLVHSRVRRR